MKIKYSGYPPAEKTHLSSGWIQWGTDNLISIDDVFRIGRPADLHRLESPSLSHAMVPVGASVGSNGQPIIVFQNSWGSLFRNSPSGGLSGWPHSPNNIPTTTDNPTTTET